MNFFFFSYHYKAQTKLKKQTHPSKKVGLKAQTATT